MAGYSTLSDFITHVNTVGLPTASHYHLIMEDIVNVEKASTIQMMCDSAVIPGINIMSQEIRTMGEASDMPHGITYAPANFSFLIDNEFSARKYFDEWMNLVYDRDARTLGYYNEYAKTITVVVSDKVGKTIYAVELYEAYPKSINDISLSYANHEVMRVDVSIAFKYWRYVTAEGNAGRGSKNPPLVRSEDTPEEKEEFIPFPTLGNTVVNSVASLPTTASASLPTNLISTGNNVAASCLRSGKAAQAILTTSGMTAPGNANFGSGLGSGLASLGSAAAKFGSSMSNLGQSLTNVLAPVAAMASSVASIAGAISSVDSLLGSVGIKTNLGKISKDLGGISGQLTQISTLKGIPSKMGAVGANMTAVGGTLNTVKKSIENFPNATNQVKNAIGSFGDMFSKQGSAVSDASSNVQSDVDDGKYTV